MKMYKIENGSLIQFTGRYIKHNGKVYANPSEEQLRAAGWKQLISEDKPEDGEDYYYSPVYDDSGENIVRSWLKQEIVFEENII